MDLTFVITSLKLIQIARFPSKDSLKTRIAMIVSQRNSLGFVSACLCYRSFRCVHCNSRRIIQMRVVALSSVILLDPVGPCMFVLTLRVLFDNIFQRQIALTLPYELLK